VPFATSWKKYLVVARERADERSSLDFSVSLVQVIMTTRRLVGSWWKDRFVLHVSKN
jgi:hypothetical protein